MDVLRARAYLDILLGTDSRPAGQGQSAAPAADGEGSGPDGGGDGDGQDGDGPASPGDGGPGRPDPAGPGTPPGAGIIPARFVGRMHLTVPLATVLDLADRPGEIPGIGPVDPWLARDLARAAAQNPRTTWCLTVLDRLPGPLRCPQWNPQKCALICQTHYASWAVA